MTTIELLATYLRQIEAKKARYNRQPQPSASITQLDDLRRQSRQQLNYELPEVYTTILGLSNGVNFNSYTLYASKTLPITGYTDRFIEGFVEANKLWEGYEQNADHHLIIFGETGGELFLFDHRDGMFKVTDKVGGDAYQQFNTFEELAEQLFKSMLGIYEEDGTEKAC